MKTNENNIAENALIWVIHTKINCFQSVVFVFTFGKCEKIFLEKQRA